MADAPGLEPGGKTVGVRLPPLAPGRDERNARRNPASLEARGTHPEDGSGELYK